MTQALDRFLTAFWSAFEVAESSGDFSSVAPMCADNLVFQSPSEEPYETLESLVAAWWTPPDRGDGWKLTHFISNIDRVDDPAYRYIRGYLPRGDTPDSLLQPPALERGGIPISDASGRVLIRH